MIPFEEFLHAVFYLDLVRPAKAMELGYVDQLAHGAVGLGGIKLNNALETDGLDNQLGEFADGEFLACAHVDVAVANLA